MEKFTDSILIEDELGNTQEALIQEIFEMNGKDYILLMLIPEYMHEEPELLLCYYSETEKGPQIEPVEDETEIEMVEIYLSQKDGDI